MIAVIGGIERTLVNLNNIFDNHAVVIFLAIDFFNRLNSSGWLIPLHPFIIPKINIAVIKLVTVRLILVRSVIGYAVCIGAVLRNRDCGDVTVQITRINKTDAVGVGRILDQFVVFNDDSAIFETRRVVSIRDLRGTINRHRFRKPGSGSCRSSGNRSVACRNIKCRCRNFYINTLLHITVRIGLHLIDKLKVADFSGTNILITALHRKGGFVARIRHLLVAIIVQVIVGSDQIAFYGILVTKTLDRSIIHLLNHADKTIEFIIRIELCMPVRQRFRNQLSSAIIRIRYLRHAVQLYLNDASPFIVHIGVGSPVRHDHTLQCSDVNAQIAYVCHIRHRKIVINNTGKSVSAQCFAINGNCCGTIRESASCSIIIFYVRSIVEGGLFQQSRISVSIAYCLESEAIDFSHRLLQIVQSVCCRRSNFIRVIQCRKNGRGHSAFCIISIRCFNLAS